MANCSCCGCVLESDYGTSIVTGDGSQSNPYSIALVDPTWQRPAARVRRTTTQSIPLDLVNYTAASFDIEIFDTGNFWTIGSPTRFTITEPGIYLFGGCFLWDNSGDGIREIGIRLNGTTLLLNNHQPTRITNEAGLINEIEYQWKLNTGDYIELMARHENHIGSLNITPETESSIVFWIVYAGRTI